MGTLDGFKLSLRSMLPSSRGVHVLAGLAEPTGEGLTNIPPPPPLKPDSACQNYNEKQSKYNGSSEITK